MRFAATFVAVLPLFFSANVLGWHDDDPDCSSTITNYLPKSTSIVILPTSTWTGNYVKTTPEGHVPISKPDDGDNSSDRGHESDNHEGKGSEVGNGSGSGSEGGSGSENAGHHEGDKGGKGEPVPSPPVQAGASSGKPETLVVASLVALVGLFFVY